MARRSANRDSPHLHSATNPGSSTEGSLESAERHQRGELIHEQEERTSDETATVIPFPSEEAQAAAGARQSSWTARTLRDWSQFLRVREKYTFEEKIERKKRKYKEKLRRAKLARPNAQPSTIIPFPSEQAQAAGGSDDPPDDD